MARAGIFPMAGSLLVLWEDPYGLVVVKPAGTLTNGGEGDEVTVESMVRRHLNPVAPSSIYLGTVHRLDRPVSGAILWAKTPKAARRWSDQFARREVRKEYWAIVEGDASPLGESGVWDDLISPPDANGRARLGEGSTRATTHYEVVRDRDMPEGFARLKLRPVTGRTHQLRAQSSGRGLPIVGDSTYGATRPFAVGIGLHARSLRVEHPVRRVQMTFEAPVPDSWSVWVGPA